ncbi:MAG TPA: malto-oligosyltrehalose trehalohydrolase [Candidatus Binatia bacterium]|nr:malto-oligosyltrehalose trehalohydrolase [Candidatus Binatia bacterium]
MNAPARRLPLGAEVGADGVHFRVWAPACRTIEVCDPDRDDVRVRLAPDGDGWFAGASSHFHAGSRYALRLNGDPALRPDPASRFQPDGPHGPSVVVDPSSFAWTDVAWRGVETRGQVVYELHVGTFTPEGTYAALAEHLPYLRDLGVTIIELMPIAEFPGRFGWGYDGVGMYAPTRLYGTPDDLRRLVDRAHAIGLGIILDVVYNHVGPDGNYLSLFAPQFFTDRHENDWGTGLDFDGPESAGVRTFFVENAGYWISEFHMDGLRLDATQSIHDDSDRHVLAEIAQRVRVAGAGRGTWVVAENEVQEARLARPETRGGHGIDALWNDDFHHSAVVALTGHREAYYTDYVGSMHELLAALRWGFLYQGQHYSWQRQRRGTSALDLDATNFVTFLENHDQVANSGDGARLWQRTDPGHLRAMTALWLLGPPTPMLFQGQEFAASAPFLFFADHQAELARQVASGRREFLRQFPSLAGDESQRRLDDPADPATFFRCRIDHRERETHAPVLALHRDLLRLRREEPAFRQQCADRMFGAVPAPAVLVLRFREDGGDRLVIANLGHDLHLSPAPEPLLAPPDGTLWETQWSSEDPCYGGAGITRLEHHDGWHLPGRTTTVLRPRSTS